METIHVGDSLLILRPLSHVVDVKVIFGEAIYYQILNIAALPELRLTESIDFTDPQHASIITPNEVYKVERNHLSTGNEWYKNMKPNPPAITADPLHWWLNARN